MIARSTAAAALVTALLCSPASAQKTLGRIVRLDPRLDALIPKDAEIEVLAKGFTWAEGPLWMPDEKSEARGYVLFSDIPRNSIFKWEEGQGISLFMKPSGYTGVEYYGLEPGSNGLIRDPVGRLVMCEHGDRRISVLTKGGGKRTLVDNYRGKRLNSPNDGCFDSKGNLFFTDPPYGFPDREKDERQELGFYGVYWLSAPMQRNVGWSWTPKGYERDDGVKPFTVSVHVDEGPGRRLKLLTKEMTRPNGIALSPDEKTLYVAQSDPRAALWKAFPIERGEVGSVSLGKSRVVADVTEHVGKMPGGCDGLKVDEKGHLFATGPGGVWIMTPEGEPLGRIETGQRTANCNWGNDGRTLYITADSFLLRVRTTTKGAGW